MAKRKPKEVLQMKLSEDLETCHVSGDFGQGLAGYLERAKALEESVEWSSGRIKDLGKKLDQAIDLLAPIDRAILLATWTKDRNRKGVGSDSE